MERNQKTKGVLLLGFGGPAGPEDVEPFMVRLLGGHSPGPEVLARVCSRYQAIGGSSPFLKITLAQAAALEEKLLAEEGQLNGHWQVYVGMGHWHPWIKDEVARMQRDGIKQAVAISLAPFYSKFSTGAYARSLGLALQEYQDIEIKLCQQWHMHPLYIRALAKQVKAALIGTSPRETGATPVVFTMHSLPLSHLEAEDPYVTQAQEAMTAVLSQLEGQPGFLAFQSKGGSLGPWLKPEVSSVLLDLSRAGYRRAVLLPFGFVSDHLETLYDLDIELQHYARSIGLELVRVPALNDNPDFILALADIARKNFNLFFAAGSSL